MKRQHVYRMKVTQDTTVVESRRVLFEKVNKGHEAKCSVCGQLMAYRPRYIRACHAVALRLLYLEWKKGVVWTHVETMLMKHGIQIVGSWREIPLLQWWGMIEKKPEQKPDGNPRAGFWRITQEGRDFVERRPGCVFVPGAVVMYNNMMQRFDDKAKRVSLKSAASRHFDYQLLMKGVVARIEKPKKKPKKPKGD